VHGAQPADAASADDAEAAELWAQLQQRVAVKRELKRKLAGLRRLELAWEAQRASFEQMASLYRTEGACVNPGPAGREGLARAAGALECLSRMRERAQGRLRTQTWRPPVSPNTSRPPPCADVEAVLQKAQRLHQTLQSGLGTDGAAAGGWGGALALRGAAPLTDAQRRREAISTVSVRDLQQLSTLLCA